jgi:hypothetical protein
LRAYLRWNFGYLDPVFCYASLRTVAFLVRIPFLLVGSLSRACGELKSLTYTSHRVCPPSDDARRTEHILVAVPLLIPDGRETVVFAFSRGWGPKR